MRPRVTPLPKCKETFPASPVSPCICLGAHELHMDEFDRSWMTETVQPIAQEQPQHHDEPTSVTFNVRELVRDNTIASRAHYEGTRDLLESLENTIRDQETEIKRLIEEQIKPLADFLMQQSDVIGHPGDEGACAMAIRVIGELMVGD